MANRTPQAQLSELLLSLFSADELRRFVRYLPDGDALVRSLPGANASPAQLAAEVVQELDRHGLIQELLFARLTEQRPRRAREIDALRLQFDLHSAGPLPTHAAKPGGPPQVVVLCDASGLDAVDILRRHLKSWVTHGQISLETIHVDEWSPELVERPGSVCVLLLTAGLLAGPNIQDQLQDLMALQRVGKLQLVPVLVTPTRWRTTVLGRLPPLPANGLPVSTWSDPDAAWSEVVQGIARTLPGPPASTSEQRLEGALQAIARASHPGARDPSTPQQTSTPERTRTPEPATKPEPTSKPSDTAPGRRADAPPTPGLRGASPAPGPAAPTRVPTADTPVLDADVVAAAPRLQLPRSRVLHLSDLHLGSQAQALLWYDQLLLDLRSELACDQLDAVILSGDITNRAASDEFAAASQFLRDLKDDFKLAPHQFILVPGNHDLSWTLARRAYRVMRRADHDGLLSPGAFIDNGDHIEVPVEAELRGRFQPFADFYYSVRNEAYPLDYEHQATIHHFPAKKLLILGLNSAWWLDHAFTTRADIHGVALGRALRRIQQEPRYVDTVKLAVFHHPVDSPDADRLRDTGFVERLAQAGFRLALHGHIHRPQTGLFRYDMTAGGRQLDFLGAGTFGAPTREWVPGFPLQYQLLEFSDANLRVHTRRREALNGAWKPDARWSQGPGKNPLAHYDIDL